MEIIAILRVVRRHWLLATLGLVIAALAGLATLYQASLSPFELKNRATYGGVALGRSMLTTRVAPSFQLSSKAELAGTLTNRAAMLATLLATDSMREDIARRAGIDAADLAVFPPAARAPNVMSPIAVEATAAAAIPREPYRVDISTGSALPFITVRAGAPDPAIAAKIVEAVRETIAQALVRRSGSEQFIDSAPLGPVSSGVVADEPSKAFAVIAAVLVAAFWWGGLVIVAGLASRLRRRRRSVPSAAIV